MCVKTPSNWTAVYNIASVHMNMKKGKERDRDIASQESIEKIALHGQTRDVISTHNVNASLEFTGIPAETKVRTAFFQRKTVAEGQVQDL